jgi:hypothetical protein
MDATIVCIDQTKKSVQVELRAAWFPRGTRPSVELSGERDQKCLLGVIAEDAERFSSGFSEYSPPTREILSQYVTSIKIVPSSDCRISRCRPHGPNSP